MGSVEAAKAYLMKANAEGLSLYDHLAEVVSKLLAEKPEDALEQIEAISADIKATRFVGGEPPAGAPVLDERTLARAQELLALFKGPDPVVDADGNVDVPEKNAVAVPTAVGLMEASEMLERAGLGLGKSETYRVALAVKTLSEDPAAKLTSCRFWGKIYGTQADYLICEGTTGERELNGVEQVDPFGEDKAVALEAPGVGANKCVYYVCAKAGEAWVQLPDVTPAQITAAGAIKKLFTGNLDTAINTYPAFPGNEANYLRAQITRISVDTAIAPAGYLVEKEAEEAEAEEEEEIDRFCASDADKLAKYRAKCLATVADGQAYKDTEYEVADAAEFSGDKDDMEAFAEPGQWVHTARPLLTKQGRCTWYPIPKTPMEPLGEDDAEPEEPEPEEPEEPPAAGESIEGDAAVAGEGEEDGGEPAWRIRKHMTNVVNGRATVVSLKSVKWPGAVTVSAFGGPHAVQFSNAYFGNGAEYQATTEGVKPFSPQLPADVQTEWAPAPTGEDEEEGAAQFVLTEAEDPTVEQEEEEIERQEGIAEGAVDEEGDGEGE